MKHFNLIRVCETLEGTFGVLIEDTAKQPVPFALTLERRWLDNKVGESCIPDGDYVCERVKSPKFGDTFEVKNVPGRSAILFHKGNLMDDTHGCILVGEQFGALNFVTALLASGPGFAEFLSRLAGENRFNLTIHGVEEEV